MDMSALKILIIGLALGGAASIHLYNYLDGEMRTQKQLTSYLVDTRTLKSQHIIDAFNKIDRADFVPAKHKKNAYIDHAMSIGYGQTISQPTVVAFMLELLKPGTGEKILDVGTGSGWTTALLAECVGSSGKVYGVELIPELVEFGQQNLGKYNFLNVKLIQAKKGIIGLPDAAPFDKILVSAAAESIPEDLLVQFNFRLVIPIQNSIWVFDKDINGQIKETEYRGFFFVPLISS